MCPKLIVKTSKWRQYVMLQKKYECFFHCYAPWKRHKTSGEKAFVTILRHYKLVPILNVFIINFEYIRHIHLLLLLLTLYCTKMNSVTFTEKILNGKFHCSCSVNDVFSCSNETKSSSKLTKHTVINSKMLWHPFNFQGNCFVDFWFLKDFIYCYYFWLYAAQKWIW